MKKGEIILLKCSDQKVHPILVIGKKAENIIGLQVQGYSESNQVQNKTSTKKQREIEKRQLEEKKKLIELRSVVIGKPDGLRYESIVKVNKEIVIEIENVIATISKIDDRLLNEVLDKYKEYRSNQILQNELHKELHELKQKILLCQMNNQRYDNYEKRLSEVLKKLDFPEVHAGTNQRAYKGFREVPTKGYIKVYKGGR